MCAANVQSLYCLEGVDLAFGRPLETAPEVNIKLLSNASVFRIMPFRGRLDETEKALRSFGVDALPPAGRFVETDTYRLAWAEKNCWHLMAVQLGGNLENRLIDALQGKAAVSEASDGLLCVEIEGVKSRALLAKGCVLDLEQFKPGYSAVSLMAHTRVFIQRSAQDRFCLMIPASYAASFWEWLSMSAAEFTVSVSGAVAIWGFSPGQCSKSSSG